MENPSTKDENPQEDLVLYNTILPIHMNSLDDKDSNNSINFSDEKEENLNGRWNQDEHIRFIKGCLLYGNNWKKVKKYVKSRSSAQIRSHAQKYLIKLNKKYRTYDFGKNKFSDNNDNNSFDNEFIESIVNNFNFSNVDMDKVEKMILFIFKNSNGNCVSLSERGYNGIDIDGINFKDYSYSEGKEIKNKKQEKIFKICKIPKEQKKEYDLIEKNQNSFLSKKRYPNKIDYSQMYNNSNGINNFGIEPNKMIQIEKFVNICLDSNDPIDLTKLLLFFDPNNYIINPINYFDPNILYSQQQNRERDMYNSMKAYLNESYNNQNTDISGKTTSTNSVDNEKQKQLNYQQTIAMEIAKINPNLEHLYPNTLNGLFNNYSNFNGFQTTLPINQFLFNNRFQNFNG